MIRQRALGERQRFELPKWSNPTDTLTPYGLAKYWEARCRLLMKALEDVMYADDPAVTGWAQHQAIDVLNAIGSLPKEGAE